jgi:hypothetical protein
MDRYEDDLSKFFEKNKNINSIDINKIQTKIINLTDILFEFYECADIKFGNMVINSDLTVKLIDLDEEFCKSTLPIEHINAVKYILYFQLFLAGKRIFNINIFFYKYTLHIFLNQKTLIDFLTLIKNIWKVYPLLKSQLFYIYHHFKSIYNIQHKYTDIEFHETLISNINLNFDECLRQFNIRKLTLYEAETTQGEYDLVIKTLHNLYIYKTQRI